MDYKKLEFTNYEDRKAALISVCGDAFTAEELESLIHSGLLTAPASTRYHGAYEGGLFDHSINVANVLQKLTVELNLQWEDSASPIRIGLLHDLCKTDSYIIEEQDIHYNSDTIVRGHGEKSVIYAQMITSLNSEEIACILYHMGAFMSDKDAYTYAAQQYPNVLWTHTADMVASQIMGV